MDMHWKPFVARLQQRLAMSIAKQLLEAGSIFSISIPSAQLELTVLELQRQSTGPYCRLQVDASKRDAQENQDAPAFTEVGQKVEKLTQILS